MIASAYERALHACDRFGHLDVPWFVRGEYRCLCTRCGLSWLAPTEAEPAPKRLPDQLAVKVYEEDVELGQREDMVECALGRAIRRTLVLAGHDDFCWVRVVHDRVVVHAGRDGLAVYRYGPETDAFLDAFDGGLKPAPHTAQLCREGAEAAVPQP